MLNVGNYPAEDYMKIGDIVNVFENRYSAYPTAQIPNWAYKYPSTKFSHLIYGATSTEMTHVLALAQQRNVGYIYVTDGVLPNPWDTLPSYWSSEISQLHATCINGNERWLNKRHRLCYGLDSRFLWLRFAFCICSSVYSTDFSL